MEVTSIQTICCHLSTLCHHSSSPSLHLSMFQDLREYHHHRQPCPVLRDIAAEVRLLDIPHFMLPWRLCVHMLEDYVRPFKHPVDEIIRALWAMRWHHKHRALSCSLALLMWAVCLKSLVEVKPASLKHRLIAVIAVECCCKLISREENDSKQTNNVPYPWNCIFSFPLWLEEVKVHLT